MTLDEIKQLLRNLNFPNRWVTDQTAICILALQDKTPRKGLLSGHASLSEGARIHDILNFARQDLARPVAENTREAYRKSSLRPLMEAGWLIRHQLSTNDPNTYYRLHPDFSRLLSNPPEPGRSELINRLRIFGKKQLRKSGSQTDEIRVELPSGGIYSLSPGEHNRLEKSVVEILGPALIQNPQVLYLGDTAPRAGYQNRALMRQLNLPIDVSVALPDVILFDQDERSLIVVEAVTSSGPVTEGRIYQIQGLVRGPVELGIKLICISAFPSRSVFRKFVEQIAWNSSVWIADEPYNLIHFVTLPV